MRGRKTILLISITNGMLFISLSIVSYLPFIEITKYCKLLNPLTQFWKKSIINYHQKADNKRKNRKKSKKNFYLDNNSDSMIRNKPFWSTVQALLFETMSINSFSVRLMIAITLNTSDHCMIFWELKES